MVQAETSLREFQKKLTADIMVPIGSKALMPGQLYHTGEVLVGHGNKTFSKCTTLQAIKICKHRQNYASTRLEQLETERNLYRNKIELPFVNEAFSSGGQEIIEEYDEAKEKMWREDHRKRVAESKKKEADERNRLKGDEDKSHEDIMNLLDELELMEDLDVELEQMDVNTDEQLRKLLSGEVKPPREKKRTAHSKKTDPIVGMKSNIEDINEVTNQPSRPLSPPPKPPRTFASSYTNDSENIKVTVAVNGPRAAGPSYETYETSVVAKPNSPVPNHSSASDESDDETILSARVQKQWKKIQEETKTMNKTQKEKYLKKKLKEVVTCVRNIEVHDERTLDIKLDLEELEELLKDELIRLEPTESVEVNESVSTFEAAVTASTITETPEESTEIKKKRRSKISFAEEDEIKLIDKFEAPSKISEPILEDTEITQQRSRPKTLEIKIKFTNNEPISPLNAAADQILSPSDIYEKILKPHTATQQQDDSFPMEQTTKKSILKNKEKVLEEIHIPEEVVPVPKKPKKSVVAIKQILGEILERPVQYQEPEKNLNQNASGSKSEAKISKFKSNRTARKK